jgi:hypothetical protein
MKSRTLLAVLVVLVLMPVANASAHGSDLRQYAATTWASFTAMTDEQSGLPADSLSADGTRSVQTSTTNIGAYMWSAVAAERLGIIRRKELVDRLSKTITTLEHMERFGSTGQYFNWYDHRTGAKLLTFPDNPNFHPWLSSVDNGWLAVGLRIVENSVPQLRKRAGALYDAMDWGFYYRADANRVLFHYQPEPLDTPCCYDTVVSESRIVDYLGVSRGQIPQKAYYGRNRTFPDTCDWSWTETKPVGGVTRTYFGVDVFEAALPYAGMRVVPSWSGSMFEALMPSLFVPEEQWAPRSWGINHPLTVRSQIHHGLQEAGYGYWGFSPSNTPEGGYGVYGVDGIGSDPGNFSNEDRTLIDHGWPGCPDRPALPDPPQSAYTNGVVTPHASFLALRYAPREATENLKRLARDFPGLYTKWGFRDSVNVDTGAVSGAYLSLDQGMIMAALGNALGHDVLRRAFADRDLERAVRPVIGVEQFSAGR